MKSFNWKKTVGLVLSIFVLFFGSVGLTGCEVGGEGEEQEEELEQEGELEQEEQEDDDDDD